MKSEKIKSTEKLGEDASTGLSLLDLSIASHSCDTNRSSSVKDE